MRAYARVMKSAPTLALTRTNLVGATAHLGRLGRSCPRVMESAPTLALTRTNLVGATAHRGRLGRSCLYARG